MLDRMEMVVWLYFHLAVLVFILDITYFTPPYCLYAACLAFSIQGLAFFLFTLFQDDLPMKPYFTTTVDVFDYFFRPSTHYFFSPPFWSVLFHSAVCTEITLCSANFYFSPEMEANTVSIVHLFIFLIHLCTFLTIRQFLLSVDFSFVLFCILHM